MTPAHPKPSPTRPQDDPSSEGAPAAEAVAPKGPAPWITWVARVAEALLPTADGGPPPILRSVRGGLIGWVEGSLGLILGSAIGLVLVLAVMGLPGMPGSLVTFGVGILVGATAAVVVVVRRRGNAAWAALAVLLLPIVLLSLPLLLLYGLVAFLVGLVRRRPPPADDRPEEPEDGPAAP